MQPEARKLLIDMRDTEQAITEFVADRKATCVKGDNLLRSAIYHQFTLIGEALSQLVKLHRPLAQRISEYSRIIAFRNQIIHGSAKIDDEITWRIVQDKLPILR